MTGEKRERMVEACKSLCWDDADGHHTLVIQLLEPNGDIGTREADADDLERLGYIPASRLEAAQQEHLRQLSELSHQLGRAQGEAEGLRLTTVPREEHERVVGESEFRRQTLVDVVNERDTLKQRVEELEAVSRRLVTNFAESITKGAPLSLPRDSWQSIKDAEALLATPASPSPAVGEGHVFPDSWAERRFCARCGVSWEARDSEPCKTSPSPQVAQASAKAVPDERLGVPHIASTESGETTIVEWTIGGIRFGVALGEETSWFAVGTRGSAECWRNGNIIEFGPISAPTDTTGDQPAHGGVVDKVDQLRADIVEVLRHVELRTRNAAGETNMTGLLLGLVAQGIEKGGKANGG